MNKFINSSTFPTETSGLGVTLVLIAGSVCHLYYHLLLYYTKDYSRARDQTQTIPGIGIEVLVFWPVLVLVLVLKIPNFQVLVLVLVLKN